MIGTSRPPQSPQMTLVRTTNGATRCRRSPATRRPPKPLDVHSVLSRSQPSERRCGRGRDNQSLYLVADRESARCDDGRADCQAAVAFAVDRTEDIEILLNTSVDALGLRPGDHDAASDPLPDIQLRTAEANPGADQRVLAASVEENVGAEAPRRPVPDCRPRQQRDVDLPTVVERPGRAAERLPDGIVLEVRRFSNTRSPGSAAARRVTGRPSQSDSVRSSSAVVPSGKVIVNAPSLR